MRGHTPPATSAPESGPMMKDMARTDFRSHTLSELALSGSRGPIRVSEGLARTRRVSHWHLATEEMVTAESLNFDVLQITFSYLSPSDLASVSQVCQSFLAGALPRLYRSLGFYHNQAKRYPRVCYPSQSRKSDTPGN